MSLAEPLNNVKQLKIFLFHMEVDMSGIENVKLYIRLLASGQDR